MSTAFEVITLLEGERRTADGVRAFERCVEAPSTDELHWGSASSSSPALPDVLASAQSSELVQSSPSLWLLSRRRLGEGFFCGAGSAAFGMLSTG